MAGITHFKEFTEPALRGLVVAMEEDRALVEDSVTKFLEEENVYSNTFAHDVIQNSNYLAAMIGVGAEPPVVDRNQVAKVSGELAKYGLKDIVTEQELLDLNAVRSDAETSAVVDKLVIKGANLVKALQDRIDITKSQAISLGKIEYDNNGAKIIIDYTKHMPDSHKVVLTTNTWADADHDVIGDLIAWDKQYQDTNGKQADSILMTRQTQSLLLVNSKVVAEASGSVNTGRGRVSVDELNSVIGAYGLPEVTVVSRNNPTTKNLYTGENEVIETFPDGRVVFVSAGVGKFIFGPTVENNLNPGISLNAYDLGPDPFQSVIRVAAAGFAVIDNPSLLLFADVVE